MANTINLVTKYLPLVDEVYKADAKSAILDTPETFVRETLDAKTVMIAKRSTTGLGNYSKANGYPAGAVTLTWESHTFAYDRGVSFNIDYVDNEETLGLSFAGLAGEVQRVAINPELDAVRFASYASAAITASNTASAAITSSNVDAAINTAEANMIDGEVEMSNVKLFVSSTAYTAIKQSANFTRTLAPSENPDRNLGAYDDMDIIVVPQSRFYTAVTLYDGVTEGQTDGGYVKKNDALDINFLMVDPAAVMQIVKRSKVKVFDADENQTADAIKIAWRVYHDAWVLANKVDGVYVHTKPAA